MRCLVLWADNASPNLGVRVLARGTAALADLVSDSTAEIDFQDFAAGDSPVAFSPSMFLKDFGRPAGPMKRRLEGYDLVLDTGAGDSFTDAYGFKRLILMHHVRRLIRRNKTAVVMTPQTLGPFTTPIGRIIARWTFSRSASVIARESMSADYARGLGAGDVPTTTDVVFALPPAEPAEQRDVIVNVSGLLWTESRFGPREEYRGMVSHLIRGLTDAGARVTLLAHVLDNPSPDNDVLALDDLRDQLGDDVEIVIPTSLDEARSVIAGSRLVVGSRMHACLNAISQGIPTLPLAYSRKFAPLFNELGWRHGVSVSDAIRDPDAILSEALRLREDGKKEAEACAAAGRERLELAVTAMRAALTAQFSRSN